MSWTAIVSFAFRNIWRNKQRSLVTIGAMAFAGTIMIFFAGLGAGFSKTMERNAVEMNVGDLQIHAPGYRADPDLYATVNNTREIMERLDKAGFYSSERLYGYGLAAKGNASSGVWIRGVDVENEPRVTLLNRHVLSGEWVAEADHKGVVIGKKLAHSLGAKPGDEIVLVSQSADGSTANGLYIVRGVLKSVGEAIDRGGLFMVGSEFRKLLAVPEGAHEIAVARKDKTAGLSSATETAVRAAPGYEVKNWRQLQPLVAKILDNMVVELYLILFIAYSTVGMIVLNAMLMNVFERIHEFGVMKAVGMSPARVFAVIAVEAVAEGLLAVVLSLAGGGALVLHYQTHGIDLSKLMSGGSVASVAMDPIWNTSPTPVVFGVPVFFMFVTVCLAAIYPALKAVNMRPLDAIHYQ